MPNKVIKKKLLIKGDKGDSGNDGVDKTVPKGGLLFYDGDEIPEGYELYKDLDEGGENE